MAEKVQLQIRRRAEKGEGDTEVDTTPPRVEVANGGYRGVFERAKEPFEVPAEEAEQYLKPTGEFEPFKPAPKKAK